MILLKEDIDCALDNTREGDNESDIDSLITISRYYWVVDLQLC